MKITKFEHSCLLVEMPAPQNRTTLFDPGMMSETALEVSMIDYLDDIVITHSHVDHLSLNLMKQLVAKFPAVKITAPADVVDLLEKEAIAASSDPSEGISFFDAPHEAVEPLFVTPDQIGVHYLARLTHPGDSHSFSETKAILALPVTAPWGATTTAVKLALELKPKFVLPIHDWHWRPEARDQMYGALEQAFAQHGITFVKLVTGEPVTLEV